MQTSNVYLQQKEKGRCEREGKKEARFAGGGGDSELRTQLNNATFMESALR